jgi:hypothetical protein
MKYRNQIHFGEIFGVQISRASFFSMMTEIFFCEAEAEINPSPVDGQAVDLPLDFG